MNEAMMVDGKFDLADVKGRIIEWQGGKPVDLKKKFKDGINSGRTVGDVLGQHCKETLELELRNQEKRIKNIKKWEQLYRMRRPEKGYPYKGVANVCSSMTRSDVDAVFVRAEDMITNKRRIYLMSLVDPNADTEEVDRLAEVEKAFDHYLKKELKYKEKIRFPLKQATKIGTGLGKIVFEEKKKTIYRFADEDEKGDRGVDKYSQPGGDALVKDVSVNFKGPTIYPISREDFFISSDAVDIDDAYSCGFRFYLRKPEVELRAKTGLYEKDKVRDILPTDFSDNMQERASQQGKTLEKTEYEKPYEFWEMYLKYDVDEDGEEDDIVVTLHRQSGRVVRAIYNPVFYGYRPLFDLKGSPVEYVYDGEGICEILEPIQDEVDAYHNLHLDRLAQINLPMVLVRSGVGLDKLDKLVPGIVQRVDDDLEGALRVVEFSQAVYSITDELARLTADGDRAIGITPNVLGLSTAERPVAKETFANIEEANKKFKSWVENVRSGVLELGYKLLECFAQHQPVYEYMDEFGTTHEVEMPLGDIRNYLKLDLEVSSEQMNMEIRREISLAAYQLVKDYMTGLSGMAQLITSPAVPSDFKSFLLMANDIGAKLLKKILENFDLRDPESMVPDITKAMDVEKNLQMSADMMPQQQGVQPAGQPGQLPGQPPMMGQM